MNAAGVTVNIADSASKNANRCRDTEIFFLPGQLSDEVAAGLGDGCDDCTNGSEDPSNDGDDTDGDGICDYDDNGAEADNCRALANSNQLDEDDDGVADGVNAGEAGGNPCDTCTLNGVREGPELCDDGNFSNCDSCTNDCKPGPNLVFADIEGGNFTMGNNRDRSARPAHAVNVPDFQLGIHEVTVEAYRMCVEAGACTEPAFRRGTCNYSNTPGANDTQPVNCVNYLEARAFAAWCSPSEGLPEALENLGVQTSPPVDLPTEAQWEYAAQNAGASTRYPTGNSGPSCDEAQFGNGRCGTRGPVPVCSRGAIFEDPNDEFVDLEDAIEQGVDFFMQTEQGVCDLAGNLQEWTLDNYLPYRLTPTDGSAAVASGRYRRARFNRTFRGGSWRARSDRFMTSSYRRSYRENRTNDQLGFRVACTDCFNALDPYIVNVLSDCDDQPRVGSYSEECFCAIAADDGGGGLSPVECQD